jgi:hypothetical protein
MKKAIKPTIKKPAPKKPAAKKSSAKPRRKAAGQSELAAIVARLDAIADKLSDATGQLVEAAVRLSAAQGSQPVAESQNKEIEKPGEVVGVMLVDESGEE